MNIPTVNDYVKAAT